MPSPGPQVRPNPKKKPSWGYGILVLVVVALFFYLLGRSSAPTEFAQPSPTSPDQVTEDQGITDLAPNFDPNPPAANATHTGLDHFKAGVAPLIIADDFNGYCGVMRDEYWHLMNDHDSSTFVFVNFIAGWYDYPSNEIVRRLTMCGLDLNNEACVGPACDWESPPVLSPDGQIAVPPRFKEQR